jgi:hypothetical protein
VLPHVIYHELEAAYKQMAQDKEHEAEALEWAEGIFERKAKLKRAILTYRADKLCQVPLAGRIE